MEPDRNPPSDGVGVHGRKSRKDSSKRPHDKAPAKDGRLQSLLDDLLRAPRSKQTIKVTSSNPSVAASNSKPVSGSASQSTLADFTQTKATVSILSDLDKQRNNEKTSDTGSTDSVENPKRKKLDLNSFKFGRKAPFSASGSPSPPSVRFLLHIVTICFGKKHRNVYDNMVHTRTSSGMEFRMEVPTWARISFLKVD